MKNNYFKEMKPDWYLILNELAIFSNLQRNPTSYKRSEFNFIALKIALENEFNFIVEQILDGSIPITSKMV